MVDAEEYGCSQQHKNSFTGYQQQTSQWLNDVCQLSLTHLPPTLEEIF